MGIHVLVAPSGSGKTTYLRSYANRQSRKQLFTSFGDENRENDLFELIPKKSVIIIDHDRAFWVAK